MLKTKCVRVFMLGAAVAAAGCGSDGGGAADMLATCARISGCLGGRGDSLSEMCAAITLASRQGGASAASSDRLAMATLECARAATTCDEMERCAKATPAQAAVCAGGDGDRCAGSVLVECDGTATPDAFDCAAAGLVCGQATDADCGTAACDPAAAPDHCDGSLVVTCDSYSNVVTTNDCRYRLHVSCSSEPGGPMRCQTEVGDACAMIDGEPRCQGTGEACDAATFVNRCEGTTMVTCAQGQVGRRDCVALDPALTCGIDSSGATRCEPRSTECDPQANETCADGVITFCLFGMTTSLDCRAYGLAGCMTRERDEHIVADCTSATPQ